MTAPVSGTIQPGTSMVDDSRKATRANLDKAAQQFEAVFVNMMLKEARKASLGDSLFQSNGLDTFRQMQDSQIAQEMGRHNTLGIAKAMSEFLARQGHLKDDAGPAATGEAGS